MWFVNRLMNLAHVKSIASFHILSVRAESMILSVGEVVCMDGRRAELHLLNIQNR